MLRDRTRLLFDVTRGCSSGVWVDWAVVAFAGERGLEPPVESGRGLRAGEVDAIGERLARTFWVLFSGVKSFSI